MKSPFQKVARVVRQRAYCQQQGGLGAGHDSMANVSESLINVVIRKQAKAADKPEPKGAGARISFVKLGDTRTMMLPAERRSLTCQY